MAPFRRSTRPSGSSTDCIPPSGRFVTQAVVNSPCPMTVSPRLIVKPVLHCPVRNAADADGDAELLLESERTLVVESRRDAGPADRGLRRRNRQARRAPQCVLRFFHVPEIAAEMNDAGHVGLGELNSTVIAEFRAHQAIRGSMADGRPAASAPARARDRSPPTSRPASLESADGWRRGGTPLQARRDRRDP